MRTPLKQKLFVVTLAGLTAVACGPEFAVVPHGGAPQAQASQAGVQITAFAEQWSGEPDDLADYITPIAVDLYNGGPNELRLTYADFALRDENGFRYVAINPFVPMNALGNVDRPAEPHAPRLASILSRPDLLAARGRGGGFHGGGGFRGGGGYAHYGGRGFYGGRRYFGGYGGGYSPWIGFHVAPGLRFYYGPSVAYWDLPFGYPLGYAGVVSYWGPDYYPARPSTDVLRFAVPEGVLQSHGHVGGFLYFQNATARGAHKLNLTWEIHDAKTSALIGTTVLALEVVKLTDASGHSRYEYRVAAAR